MNLILPRGWPSAGAILAALALGGCGTTYGTGVSPGAQTLKDITGIVSLGGADKGPPIDYEPRPGIVAPPTTAAPLPKPGTAETATNWPRDQDEMARQQKLAAANQRPDESNVVVDPGFRLPKQPVQHYEEPSLDQELLGLTGKKREETRTLMARAKAGAGGQVDAEGNPVRTTLTEPPAEYRVPDPNSEQAFVAASKGGWQFWKRRPGGTSNAAAYAAAYSQ